MSELKERLLKIGRELRYSDMQTFVKEKKAEIKERGRETLSTGRKKAEERIRGAREISLASPGEDKCRNRACACNQTVNKRHVARIFIKIT